MRYIQDYGLPSGETVEDWKQFYQLYKVYGYGNNNEHQIKDTKTKKYKSLTSLGIDAKQIQCFGNSSFIIDKDDHLSIFGTDFLENSAIGMEAFDHVKIKKMATSHNHMLIIDFNNHVWGVGVNKQGQLGLGDNKPHHRLKRILMNGAPVIAKNVSCGNSFSIILDIDNNVLVCGTNFYGRLGLGKENFQINIFTPLNIKAKAITAGSTYSFIIDEQDNVVVFGANNYGQLGVGHRDTIYTPTLIGQKAKEIKCGSLSTSIMIDMDDNVLGCGESFHSNVFIDLHKKAKHVYIGSAGFFVILDMNNDAYRMGEVDASMRYIRGQFIPLDFKAKHIACGYSHVLALKYK
jgi:alpha-tubulin suppressor-like RCC1 family protein